MTLAAIMPTLEVGEPEHARCFSLLEVLIALEKETVDPVGKVWSLPFTAAAVKEDDP